MFSLGAWSLSGNECTKNGVIKFVSSLHHTSREQEQEEESDLSLFIMRTSSKTVDWQTAMTDSERGEHSSRLLNAS